MRPLALLVPALLLAGCSMEPKYVRPDLPVPSSWPAGDAYLAQSEAALPRHAWRDVFADPRLRAIIEQSLANNQDLARAAANIVAAREQYNVRRADLLPQLDGTASYRRTDGDGESASLGLSITGYELDLFGRVRSEANAAQNRYFATEAGARATRLTLIADIASAWIAHGADSSLLAIARRTAATANDSVRLTRLRLEGGVAPRSDVRQAEIALRTAEADIAAQTTLVAQDRNALELLVGAPVDPGLLPGSIEDAAAQIAEVSAGVDSSILFRRPDVVQAEWQLRAANADIGAARAALFPRITLTGLLGLASPALGSLFSGGDFSWQAGGNAAYPIFQAGAGRANVRVSEAQRDAALASYRRAIQSAFADVADALARLGTIDAQLAASRAGREAAADNANLSELRYRGGISSYLERLTAQQALYAAERSLVNVQRLRAINRVELYRSLGGDPFETAIIETRSDADAP
jgi:outer membrane protein, multidrug efflux system